MIAPPLGWTTHCKIERVLDGDTVAVVVERRLTVRLKDCWAPEIRRPGGEEAKAALKQLLPMGSEATLFVPTNRADNLAELLTFGRVLGYLFSVDGKDVSDEMVKAQMATKEKRREY